MVEVIDKLMDVKKLNSLKYEQLSEWEVGKAVLKDIVNRWEQIGFLDGIEDEKKKEMIAVAFDNMAYDLVTENERVIKIEKRYDFNCAPYDETDNFAQFNVIVFPIIRRVIMKTDNFTYDKFLRALEKLSFLAINYDGYEYNCDFEAEYCSVISGAIEEMLNNEKENY